MGMAAQGIGQWESARTGGDSERWLSESLEHLELVGAMQDVRSLRVQWTCSARWRGDEQATAQLRQVTTSTQADDVDAAQAHASDWRRSRRRRGGCKRRSTTP